MGGGNSKNVENSKENKNENEEKKENNKNEGKKENNKKEESKSNSSESSESESEESGEESDSLEEIKEEEKVKEEDNEEKNNKNKQKKITDEKKEEEKSIKTNSSKKSKKSEKKEEQQSSNHKSEKNYSQKNSDKTKKPRASKNSKISDISKEKSIHSNILDPPIQQNHNYKRADNRIFGEFHYTTNENQANNDDNSERKYENNKEKSSEILESESSYKELTLKEKIYNEYQRHKKYLDTNEKAAYAIIDKKSYKNAKRYKYRKSLLLHEKEITCICSLCGTIQKIAYATSSIDKSIKFWTEKFVIISQIKNLEWYSTFICEFDTTNLLSSESIYVKMYDLMSDNFECIRNFRDHIKDINSILPLIDFDEEKFIFMTGGKDKILRLWDHEMDTPIKYFEGHYEEVTYIQKIASNNKHIISCSIDKTFIVWDIKYSNPLKVFNNYFNSLYLLGDNLGFCCGSYDNKIRFYDDGYILNKCLVSELYGIRYILMIDDYCILTVDIDNNINVIDLDDNTLLFTFIGYNEEVVKVIKSFNWDKDNAENKVIITACKDGYIYLYSFELEIKNKISNKEKNNNKKEKSYNKKYEELKIKKTKSKKHKKKKEK